MGDGGVGALAICLLGFCLIWRCCGCGCWVLGVGYWFGLALGFWFAACYFVGLVVCGFSIVVCWVLVVVVFLFVVAFGLAVWLTGGFASVGWVCVMFAGFGIV